MFSLIDFNPKAASESLLSAIYFAGFIVQPDHPDEILTYMKSYAICSIKKMQYAVNLSSVQALAIYCYAFTLSGNASLARICLSHFGRMSQCLGISINRKNLSDLEKYNRDLVYNFMRLYYNWAKLGSSKYTILSEEEEADLDVYDPKYQLQNSSLSFVNSDNERILYSVFSCQLFKLVSLISYIFGNFSKYDSIQIKMKIESLNTKAIQTYESAKYALESLLTSIPECKNEILVYLELIKAPYLPCILCINSKMLQISNNNNRSIEIIINSSFDLLGVFSSYPYALNLWRWVPDIIAFYLIQIYPHCNRKQRKTVISILNSIMDLYYNNSFDFNSMNYLILKSQFYLINSP
ncbi:hypothetical protein CONCODRAFT_10405 [Conidiobolus coronatus NRRL 28638]|uniref:Transcription factor domain-containing protein n=1 Tax=Conidiobolus coronatus (strain ATCC 28846 / CBS 209.66 / NRRL 28638) TaxID=796925 RepID=A0A137NXN9_CONC2|nr:hypothetical protein CONCODRAFT_10405 [Conidiobolus coronatus NRRL 28638]|eukprot:KXN67517.1 hypothetical protein CONCODRAFT_10405 [Conidiobolus coronatus NRRL 28638]